MPFTRKAGRLTNIIFSPIQGGVIGGANRITAVRQAFRSQFVSSFRKSDEQSTSSLSQQQQQQQQQQQPPLPPGPYMVPPPGMVPPPPGSQRAQYTLEEEADHSEARRKRKSRWE